MLGMDTVTVNDKTYVKAAKAADEVGYTPDYVGQLCRKGALDAMMLGKTWYVREGELQTHKQSLSRKNAIATRRDVAKQTHILHTEYPVLAHPSALTQSAYRKYLLEANIRYSPETHDLLPAVAARELFSAPEANSSEEKNEEIQGDIEVSPVPKSAEKSEETPIPIRTVAAPLRLPPKVPASDIPVRARAGADVRERYEENKIAVQRGLTQRHSLLPVLYTLIVVAFAAANLFMESTWSFSAKNQSQANFYTSYHVASVGTVMEMLREVKF